MTSQTLRIPNWHPISVNKLMEKHWGKRQRFKDADMQLVGVFAKNQGIVKAMGRRLVEVTIVLGKGQRACDPDNYNKSLLDALKRCGLIREDNRQWLDMAPYRFERSEYAATIIRLTDIEELPPAPAFSSASINPVRPKKIGKRAPA